METLNETYLGKVMMNHSNITTSNHTNTDGCFLHQDQRMLIIDCLFGVSGGISCLWILINYLVTRSKLILVSNIKQSIRLKRCQQIGIIATIVCFVLSSVICLEDMCETMKSAGKYQKYEGFLQYALFCSSLTLFIYFTYIFLRNCVQLQKRRKRPIKDSSSLLSKLKHVDSDIPWPDEIESKWFQTKQNLEPILRNIKSSFVIPLQPSELTSILTGSSMERFNVPLDFMDDKYFGNSRHLGSGHALLSDHDLMIYNGYEEASFNAESYYFIETQCDNLSPGFVNVIRNQTNSRVSGKEIVEKVYDSVMNTKIKTLQGFRTLTRNKTWKFMMDKNISYIKKSGPAVCINYYMPFCPIIRADITFGIQCIGEWPPTSDWPTRSRVWPDETVVDSIVKRGFHLVPKSQPNDIEGTTWRYSFSTAEVVLSKWISPEARKCFVALKIISKDFLKPRCKSFKSYFLKMIFYNVLEKTDENEWVEANLESCFHLLLDGVIKSIENENCPHHWIPEINLFKNFTSNDFKALKEILLEIKQRPQSYIQCLMKGV
ncbi:uncharacterized protein [Clytia hemisphaerica]